MTRSSSKSLATKSLATNAAWLLAYFAVMGLVTGGVLYGRSRALAIYGSAAAHADWSAWRDDAQKMAEQPGPVKRRPPNSAEPPALVLMRDHFAVCLSIALVLSTVLFGTFMMFLRGALQSRVGYAHRPASRDESTEND